MGNDQSRPSATEGKETARPPDYYQLLEVSEDATSDEIKVRNLPVPHTAYRLTLVQRSYRKLAVCLEFVLMSVLTP